MEGLTRLVIIYWCDLPGSSHFQMGNITTRMDITPSGLFQLAVPTRIQFVLSDHLSSLPVKLSGCIFASLVKGLSFTSQFNFLFFYSPYLNCSLPRFWRQSPLFALHHLNKVSWVLSLENEFGFDIYANPSGLLTAVSMTSGAHEVHFWKSWLYNAHQILKGQIQRHGTGTNYHSYQNLPTCITGICHAPSQSYLYFLPAVVGCFRISLLVF